MQEKLVVYLHANDLQRPSWVVLNTDSVVQQTTLHGSLEDCAMAASNNTVIVMVPAEDVLLTTVKLPRLSLSRLKKALPFALEEQLIDEVDKLHFAIGAAISPDLLSVAVVSKAKMEVWLAVFQAAGIKPRAFVPVSLCLPVQEKTWHIVVADMAIVRIDLYHGFATEIENLPALLTMAVTTQAPPNAIHINNYTDAALAPLLANIAPVKEERAAAKSLPVQLSHHAVSALNLLQGAYAVKKNMSLSLQKTAKRLAYLLGAWVFLLFCYPAISYVLLKNQVNHLDQAIADIYKVHFPAATTVVAPKTRLQAKWQSVRQAQSADRILVVLDQVGKAMQTAKSVQIKRLDFQQDELTLDLSAADADDFTAFCHFLSQQGLNVKQQNTDLSASPINAAVQIEMM